mmetsp:Transcript_30457/g.76190  ORF Transcript_30457/g.76190 Transcript_30457/m.76190 type:complete len:238 (-) Transcript_30457:1025-1738(-)
MLCALARVSDHCHFCFKKCVYKSADGQLVATAAEMANVHRIGRKAARTDPIAGDGRGRRRASLRQDRNVGLALLRRSPQRRRQADVRLGRGYVRRGAGQVAEPHLRHLGLDLHLAVHDRQDPGSHARDQRGRLGQALRAEAAAVPQPKQRHHRVEQRRALHVASPARMAVVPSTLARLQPIVASDRNRACPQDGGFSCSGAVQRSEPKIPVVQLQRSRFVPTASRIEGGGGHQGAGQ